MADTTTTPAKPHVLLVLADDLGWGNVGWHRKPAFAETQTPILDGLVKDGIELNRFYVYHACSPTRSALQTGRYPIHVNSINADPTIYNASSASGTGAGIPRNMTGMAAKLKSAGYHTVMAGKWDAGMATPTHTPHGRGYDSGLCYFHHANTYWTQGTGDSTCGVNYDLYDTTGPAIGLISAGHVDHYNESAYEEAIFHRRMQAEVEAHDASKPLFLFYSAHLVHLPLEVPQQYLNAMSKAGGGPVDNVTNQDNMRMTYAAMVKYLDDAVGKLTDQFKAKGMWENTLMWFFADNGGPIYSAGNNYPMRGGKYSEFEGGIRVAAFVSGGLIPAAKRGLRSEGIGNVADVYTTLCSIAGVDWVDQWAAAAGLPAVDGLDLSPMFLSTDVSTLSQSPRTENIGQALHPGDIGALDEYDAALALWTMRSRAADATKKTPMCYKVQSCEIDDKPFKTFPKVAYKDCCTLCNQYNGTNGSPKCVASVLQDNPGTCELHSSKAKQVVSQSKSICWLPSAVNPPPLPIIQNDASIVIGDLKLITGRVKMSVFQGPQFPNASTPWDAVGSKLKVPDFQCSTPTKVACLFNVSADPTEHHDLAVERSDDAMRLLARLKNLSATSFNPSRGDGDKRACVQAKKTGFFGPWLELAGKPDY